MKINLSEELRKQTDLGWFIIEMLTAHDAATGQSVDSIIPHKAGTDAVADVDFKINGVEIDIRHHIKRAGDQFDRCVREEAVKMVTSVMGEDYANRLDSLRHAFKSFEDLVREKVRTARRGVDHENYVRAGARPDQPHFHGT